MMRIFSREPKLAITQTDMPKLAIADRFRDQIYSHLVGNYTPVPRYPLILAIHGPAGQGKSFQCSSLLDEYGVRTLPISGSELESAVAGGACPASQEQIHGG